LNLFFLIRYFCGKDDLAYVSRQLFHLASKKQTAVVITESNEPVFSAAGRDVNEIIIEQKGGLIDGAVHRHWFENHPHIAKVTLRGFGGERQDVTNMNYLHDFLGIKSLNLEYVNFENGELKLPDEVESIDFKQTHLKTMNYPKSLKYITLHNMYKFKFDDLHLHDVSLTRAGSP